MCRETARQDEGESKFLRCMDKGLKHDAGKVYVTVKLVNYFLSSERIT